MSSPRTELRHKRFIINLVKRAREVLQECKEAKKQKISTPTRNVGEAICEQKSSEKEVTGSRESGQSSPFKRSCENISISQPETLVGKTGLEYFPCERKIKYRKMQSAEPVTHVMVQNGGERYICPVEEAGIPANGNVISVSPGPLIVRQMSTPQETKYNLRVHKQIS
jgi:hypothetical protein